MTHVHQSNWYVFSICQKKKPNAVYNAVNMGLVYDWYMKVIEKSFFANYSIQGGI